MDWMTVWITHEHVSRRLFVFLGNAERNFNSELCQHKLTKISFMGRKRRAFLSKRVSYTIMSKEIMGF
ncbi:hypothetical protein SLT67_27615 [Paenibacillus illinoisensis]